MKYLVILLLLSLSSFSCETKIKSNKQIKNKIINSTIKKDINCDLTINIHNLTCGFLKTCGFHIQLLNLDTTLLQKKIDNCKKNKLFSEEWNRVNDGGWGSYLSN